MPLWDKPAKNGAFRIFYGKLYILLLVGGGTNRRNEIITRETIDVKYGNLSLCSFP